MATFATVNVNVPSTEQRQLDLDAICQGYEYLDADKLKVVSTGVAPTSASVVLRYGDVPLTLYFQVIYDDSDSGDVEFEMARSDEGDLLNAEDDVEDFFNDQIYDDDENYFSITSMMDVAKEIGVFCICGGY